MATDYTLKALCPSNLEQQNVKLALLVFDRRIIEGLLILGNSNNTPDHTSTSDYIKITNTWWSIINVKTPCKGFHKNDPYVESLNTNNEDIEYILLNKFLNWLDYWKGLLILVHRHKKLEKIDDLWIN